MADKAKREKRMALAELEDLRYEKESLFKKLQEKNRQEEEQERAHHEKVRNMHNILDDYKLQLSSLKAEF